MVVFVQPQVTIVLSINENCIASQLSYKHLLVFFSPCFSELEKDNHSSVLINYVLEVNTYEIKVLKLW